MCGIFGWITPGRPMDRSRSAQATNLMRHRGPDDEGYLFCSLARGEAALAAGDETSAGLRLPHWRDAALLPGADALFGFRRLSIHDLSEAGHQPMGTPDGKLWIVFNGEVYNFHELRAELEQRGVAFRSRTDTEVILRAYEAWGPDCLRRFNGMWGLAVLDLRQPGQPQLFLARDRCGVKPLFYATDGRGGLVFASELKAVLATGGPWRASQVTTGNFLVWGRGPCQREGDTFVEGVRQLPPGCKAVLTGNGLAVARYWDLPEGGEPVLPEREAVERLGSLLQDAVRLRLRADVRVGSCLSGGLDSSVLVGLVQQLLAQEKAGDVQHTFSAVYAQEGPFNEKRFIDRVLEQVKATRHFAYPDGERMAAEIDRLIWHQDEPFPTTSIFAQWCVMSLARETGVTVLIDGQASDELLAGYRPYRQYFRDLFRGGRPLRAWSAWRKIAAETGDRAGGAFGSAAMMALCPGGLVQSAVRKAYLRAFAKRAARLLAPDAVQSLVHVVGDPQRTESYPWRRFTGTMDEHLRGLVRHFGLPHLLRYEDRNSMAFSIEARVPFTDYRIVEFCFSGAIDPYKIHRGWPKWILREAGRGLVPDDIIWRKDKMGFGTPENDYINRMARDWLLRGHTLQRSGGLLRTGFAAELIREAAAEGGPVDSAKASAAFRVMGVERWMHTFDLSLQ